jgi:hypothetical protein
VIFEDTELNPQSEMPQTATLFVFDENDNFVTSWLLDKEPQERPVLN